MENSPPLRVAKSGSGTIIGEIGFYLNTKRTASVIAENDCSVYRLTQVHLKKLEEQRSTRPRSGCRNIG